MRNEPDRASEIKKELEELLALETSQDDLEFGTEALKDEGRKSKKIQYKRRTDDSKDSNEDANSKKSGRSRRSRASKASTRLQKKSTDESHKKEDIEDRSPKCTSKSPKTDRKPKKNRKIKYSSKEPETAEERDRDTQSRRSRDSRGSKGLGEAVTGNQEEKIVTHYDRNQRTYRRRAKSPDSTDENEGKPSSSRRSSSMKEKAKRKSWSFDDFENNEWSSSDDEGDVEVSLKDGEEGEFALKDGESRGDRRSRSRRKSSRESHSAERRRGSSGNLSRSSSTGGLEARGSASSRRHSRKGSSGALDVGMILGDPSRRAPPRRTKSNDMNSSARFQKGLPRRCDSTDFSDYLRKQGLTHKSDRSTARTQYSDPSSLESNEQDDDDNPFEVTYHQSFNQSFGANESWDPFASGGAEGESLDDTNDRRENLRPTRSGGLLQTSSKDTISRLPAGANVRKGCSISNMGAVATTEGEEIGERERQRRSDYKKSIAAAAMAGRRLSSNGPKPVQRQARTVRSTFQESVKQLEGALQSAQ
eukprot:CAMPEP_0116117518 /NCGR_PEP_ID=MMETSP0329-20121206/1615_1 /TAXON_ID=697910 /ORGANISM="Pseudo-nitzschia arenysensis, Strain B593" /LENGTH=532 /DNA_ID=CAMNT_0003611087 /DNA_START=65 /DNA_END=1664 /DNA_ORIENTATION=+